jgi:hypothetical protein
LGHSNCVIAAGAERTAAPHGDSEWFEIPVGLLDDDPQLRPDKHIFVEVKAKWFTITDDLPQLDKKALLKHRQGQSGQ